MVDLKDRINKPRSLRGTPSYAYINKIAFYGLVLTSLVGFGFGVVWWKKQHRLGYLRNISLEELDQERQEARVQAYVHTRRQMLEMNRIEQEEAEMYPVN